jgi:pimeloyl-ACP methyl ester carboxylesterase
VLAHEQREGSGQEIASAHWIDVPGGRLHVREAGKGPLVILLHGWTLDWRIWLPQLPLTRNMRLVMPDRRGFGRSTAPANLYAERADLDIIAGHFGCEIFSIVGLSQGAAVALGYARTHPARIAALALVGTPPHGLVREPGDTAEIDRSALSELVRAGRLHDMMMQWRNHPLTQVAPHGLELVNSIFEGYDGRDQLVDQNALAFSTADLCSLTMPVLAMAGENDSLWRRQVADYIGANVPQGSTEIIQAAGHLANIDQPETINALLAAFLDAHHQQGN